MIYRSLMFTPGTQKDKLLKSISSDADALIWDLEDAVHPNEKDRARITIHEALEELQEKTNKPIFLRVNPYESDWFRDDVVLARHPNITGVILPKTETQSQVRDTWDLMNQKGELIVLIETASGLKNLDDIFKDKNITGVALGAIDFAVDLDLTLTDSGIELVYARSRIVTYAKAANISGIYDTVFPDINNLESLKSRALLTRSLGFNGQLAIHPKQLEIIHEVYSPSLSEIEWSKKVLHYAENEAKGSGVFTLEGKMIDRPVIERAKQIYDAALRYQVIS